MVENILIEARRSNGNIIQKVARSWPETKQNTEIIFREVNSKGQLLRWKDPTISYEQSFDDNGDTIFYCDHIGYRHIHLNAYHMVIGKDGEVLKFGHKDRHLRTVITDLEKTLKEMALLMASDKFYNETLFAQERDLEMELIDLGNDK